MDTASSRRRLIPRHDVDLAAGLVRQAVRETQVEMRSGGLTRETGVTGTLVTQINQQFRNATGFHGTFRARELRLREEAELGGDILLLLVTPSGDKWTQLQGKLGRRIASEWPRLQAECERMREHGSSRGLIYYNDEFIAADGRKIPWPAARPAQRPTIGEELPPHWYPLHTNLGFFFDCWGGSRRHIPAAIDPVWVIGITYTPVDTPEALSDSDGRLGRILELLTLRASERDRTRPDQG